MMNARAPRFRGVYLFAADVDAAVAFYEELGLTIERVGDILARATWSDGVALEIGGAALTQSYYSAWRPADHRGKNTINLEFMAGDQVDAAHARLVAAGHASVVAPFDAPWEARFAIILDPDGNYVGLHGPRDVDADRAREQTYD